MNEQNCKKSKRSLIVNLHIVRLTYRTLLFLGALTCYFFYKFKSGDSIVSSLKETPIIMWIIWVSFMLEMTLRFFPSKYESHGCQKLFESNYIKTGATEIKTDDNNATMMVAIVWVVFNCIFGTLHMQGIFDDDIMILISCAYSVCDDICILLFCPFQTFFFKNRCCNTCRIYNWNFAMIFTPMFFVGGFIPKSLLVLSVLLLFRWEYAFYKYPERFNATTNAYLACENCQEKLCVHKKQLKKLWKDINRFKDERIKKLSK